MTSRSCSILGGNVGRCNMPRSNLEYIDLREVTEEEHGRTSALLIESSTRQGGEGLKVTGNLPHSYVFAPKTVKDAERLRDWLAGWIERQPNSSGIGWRTNA